MKNITSLVLLFVIFSCKKEEIPVKSIEVNPSTEYVNASNVFDDFEITPLEGSEKSIIAEVTKMEVTPNIIYILDKKQSKILLFSNTGKFLNSISNIGKGPDEYITLDDFIIRNNKLLLLSRVSQKLFQYSLNGLFEKTIRLEKQYSQLENGLDGLLVFFRDFTSSSTDDLFNIELFDFRKEKVMDKFCPFLEKQNGELCFGAGRSVFASNANDLYFTLPLQHKIMQIDKNGVFSFLNIDFGSDNKLPKGIENFTYQEALKTNMIYYLDHLNINDKYIYFSYSYKFLNQNTIINRKNNKIISGYITADAKIPFSLHKNLILKNNKIITYCDPEDFNLNFYNEKNITNLIKKRGYLITDLIKNNNPILIKLKLK